MGSEALIVLGAESLSLHKNFANSESSEISIIDSSRDIKYFKTSPDLRYLGWSKSKCVEIARIDNFDIQKTLEIARNQSLGFSPKASYVWLWNSPSNLASNSEENNFFIYKIIETSQTIELNVVHSSYLKSYSLSELYWIDDENCLQLGHRSIKCYRNGVLDNRIEQLGLIQFSMKDKHVCMCIEPQDSNVPCFMKMFRYPDLTSNHLASQPFYNKRDFEFYWNYKGNIVLVTCQEKKTDDKYYYGNKSVYFLGHKGEAFKIDFPKEEVVCDVSWFPKSDQFAIIHGINTRELTIYNNSGDPINTITKGIFNKIIFSSNEDLFCLCGVGSIKCHTEFWSLNKKKVISYIETPVASDIMCMPNGVNFVFCSTFPKICINNGYSMIDYEGRLVSEFNAQKNDGSASEDILQILPIYLGDESLIFRPVIHAPKEPIDLRKKQANKFVTTKSYGCTAFNADNKPPQKPKSVKRPKKKPILPPDQIVTN